MTQTTSFLGESSFIDTGHPGTVLLHAPFDVAAFDQRLYETYRVPFPDTLARAVDKRRADFLAGRALLIRAFEALDIDPLPIPRGTDRAPIWPPGMTGSLSHSRSTCACILSTNADLRVGVDVETRLTADSDRAVRKIALSETEQALAAQAPDLPALIFCAKETLFKALYPVVQKVFGFDAAELTGQPDDNTLKLRLTRPLHPTLPEGATFTIRHTRLGAQTLTWLITPV